MKKQQETDAELLEQIRSNVRPIREPRAPFRDDPSDIAWHLRDNALPSIGAGQPYISDVTLPYLEDQAIARFRELTAYKPIHEPVKGKQPEEWRRKWVCEALAAEAHINALDPIAQAAVRVLLTASRLRGAIEDNDPQKIAALAMLLGCSVFEGGYMIEAEAAKIEHRTLLAKDRATYKKSIGAESEDHKRARKFCILEAEKLWAIDPGMRIGAVSIELNKRLLDKLDKLETLDQVQQVDTIRGWLKDAEKAGELAIPAMARRRGRDRKGPI